MRKLKKSKTGCVGDIVFYKAHVRHGKLVSIHKALVFECETDRTSFICDMRSNERKNKRSAC